MDLDLALDLKRFALQLSFECPIQSETIRCRDHARMPSPRTTAFIFGTNAVRLRWFWMALHRCALI